MKRFVKKLLIGCIAVFAILVFLAINPKIGNRTIFEHLGNLSGKLKVAFTDNSTLKINYSGVLDENGNIAASGTSIPITAKTLDGSYDFGVIGSLSNGILSIVIPPVPKDALEEYEKNIMLGRLIFDPELGLEDDNYNWIDFWFVDKPTVIYGVRFVKGWNFLAHKDGFIRYINLNRVYEDEYKWRYYD